MKLILFGSGGHAESALDLAAALNHQVVGCIDPMSTVGIWNGVPVFRSLPAMNSDHPRTFLLGIGDISIRNRVARETIKLFPDAVFQLLFIQVLKCPLELKSVPAATYLPRPT